MRTLGRQLAPALTANESGAEGGLAKRTRAGEEKKTEICSSVGNLKP